MANPYDFVPFAKVNRQKLETSTLHSQLNSAMLSGMVKCTLTVLSPLSIKSVFEELHKATSNKVFIQGSSLRGMLRTTMESLYGGCGFKIERNYHYEREFTHPKKKYEFTITYDVKDCRFPDKKVAEGAYDELSSYADCSRKIDGEFKEMPESESKNKTIKDFPLCPICSLFGLTASSGISLSGKLSFEDSSIVSASLRTVRLPRPDQPRVYRRSFYFKNPHTLPPYTETIAKNEKDKFRFYQDGEYNGRKFYLHSLNGKVAEGDFQTVYAVPPRTEFTFNVRFTNLSDYELGMLLFALKLEDGVCHKLGYGKPYGMGSVKIEPTEIKLLNKSAYECFDCPLQKDSVGIAKRIEAFKEQYRKFFNEEITDTAQFKKLREIWDCQGRVLEYPLLKEFFGKKEFENTTIQEFNEWWETGKRPTPKSKTPSKEKPEKTSTPETKPSQDVKSKTEQEEEILELPISKIEMNTPYVTTVDGKEIRVAGYVRELKEGAIVCGFVTKKKDGRLEFIQRARKNN